jgi:uncharacterized repeat protein (TIGR03803 family)
MKLRVVGLLCILFGVFGTHARAQHQYRQLREFGFTEVAASQPLSGVVEGPGGWLYGTSQGGQGGVIYRVKKDGTGFSIIFDFVGNGTPSRGPLIVGSDGLLYGTLLLPASIDGGVYSIGTDGSGFTVHALPLQALIISGMIEGQDGRLYGTTFGGGAHDGGTVFGINKNGSGFAVVHHFGSAAFDGLQPLAEPLEGNDGQLFVTTPGGGTANAGVVCRMSKSGAGFFVLHHFPALGTNDGRIPNGRLWEGPGGYLYGTTEAGGVGGEEDLFGGFGVVYRVSTDGDIYSVVRRFEGGVSDGQRPKNVFVGADGLLYGTSQNGGFARSVDGIFRMGTTGDNFTLVFTWVTSDNQSIQLNGIVESTDGNFYGTSGAGGANNAGQTFKVRPNGTQYQNLHEFSSTGSDGSNPWALVLDGDGTFYGSTLAGGANDAGTIYKLETNGNYRVLHDFAPEGGFPFGLVGGSDGFLYGSSYYGQEIFRLSKDGSEYSVVTTLQGAPVGPLIEASDFLLYGVTENGGTHQRGSVFRVNPDGSDLEDVHSFTNTSNNLVAPAGVVEASDGKLYGTTLRSGASNQGMVFRMNKDGSQYQALYSFVAPVGTLVSPNPLCEGSDGYLYGTTYRGGSNGEGIIYRISKSGGYEFIDAFAAGRGNPVGKLVEGGGGWFYGVTQESGNFNGGHLYRFRIQAAATIYILHHFGEGNLGRDPGTGVVLGSAGEIYGTTQHGGFSGGYGTLFRVDLRPILTIARTGTDILLSWPWNGETFNLQATDNLGLPWATISAGATISGERVNARVTPGAGPRFYRLQKPQ